MDASLMDAPNKRHGPLSEHVWFKLAKPEGHVNQCHHQTHKDLTRSYFSSMHGYHLTPVHNGGQATSLLSS